LVWLLAGARRSCCSCWLRRDATEEGPAQGGRRNRHVCAVAQCTTLQPLGAGPWRRWCCLKWAFQSSLGRWVLSQWGGWILARHGAARRCAAWTDKEFSGIWHNVCCGPVAWLQSAAGETLHPAPVERRTHEVRLAPGVLCCLLSPMNKGQPGSVKRQEWSQKHGTHSAPHQSSAGSCTDFSWGLELRAFHQHPDHASCSLCLEPSSTS